MIVSNKLNECIFAIPSPFDEEKTIDLYIKLDKKTKSKVKLINNSPYINVDINLKAKIMSVTKETADYKKEDITLIETYANSYIKNKIESYLYKTSKEFKSDISFFGKSAIKNFLTWDKWEEYNWLDNYTNSFFKVDVNVEII